MQEGVPRPFSHGLHARHTIHVLARNGQDPRYVAHGTNQICAQLNNPRIIQKRIHILTMHFSHQMSGPPIPKKRSNFAPARAFTLESPERSRSFSPQTPASRPCAPRSRPTGRRGALRRWAACQRLTSLETVSQAMSCCRGGSRTRSKPSRGQTSNMRLRASCSHTRKKAGDFPRYDQSELFCLSLSS